MSKSVTLRELVTQFKHQFPLLVSISRLKNPVGSDISIQKGQLLYVHFHKEFYTVDVKTSDGVKYKVPLRSSLSCSVLYQPHNNVTRAKSGYVFRNVSEVIHAKPLPKMLYVEVGYLSPNGEEVSSVEEGEILIINGVRSSNKVKVLECMNINTSEVKHLDETCTATFSTKSSHLNVDLSEVIQHLSLPLPVLLSAADDSQLFTELVCTITGKSLSQSVITSFYDNNLYDNTFQEVIEVVTDALVKVKVISLSASEKSELEKSTFDILKTFSPAIITEVIADLSTPVDTKLQTELFKYMKEDIYWCEEVVKPKLSSLKGRIFSLSNDPVGNTQMSQESNVPALGRPVSFLTSNQQEDEIYEDEIYEDVAPLITSDCSTSGVTIPVPLFVHEKDSPESTEYSYSKFERLDFTSPCGYPSRKSIEVQAPITGADKISPQAHNMYSKLTSQHMVPQYPIEKKSKSEIYQNIKLPQLLPEQVEQNITLQPQFESSDETLGYSASTGLAGLPAQQHSVSIASTVSPQSVLLTCPPLNCEDKTKNDTVQTIGWSDSLSVDSSLQKGTVDAEVKKCNQDRLKQYTVKEVIKSNREDEIYEDEIYEDVGPLITSDCSTSGVTIPVPLFVHEKDSPESTEYSYSKFERLDFTSPCGYPSRKSIEVQAPITGADKISPQAHNMYTKLTSQHMVPQYPIEKKSKSEIFQNIKLPQLLPEQVEQNITLQQQFESSDETLGYFASTGLAGLPAQQHSVSIASTVSPQSVLLTCPPLNCEDKTKNDTVQTIGWSDSLSVDSSLQKGTVDAEVKKCNQDRLKQYTVKEVLDLLDKLHLSKYKETFEEEQITGSLLLEIDEDILKEDLGVHRKLDRLKIMRVIQGRASL